MLSYRLKSIRTTTRLMSRVLTRPEDTVNNKIQFTTLLNFGLYPRGNRVFFCSDSSERVVAVDGV